MDTKYSIMKATADVFMGPGTMVEVRRRSWRERILGCLRLRDPRIAFAMYPVLGADGKPTGFVLDNSTCLVWARRNRDENRTAFWCRAI